MNKTDILNILGYEIKPEELTPEKDTAYTLWMGKIDNKYSITIELDDVGSFYCAVSYVSSIVSKTTSIISGICKNVFKTTDNLPKEQIEKLITDAIVEYRASYFNRHSILNIFGQEVKYSLFSGKFVINHSGYDIYISETNKGFYLNIFHRNEKIITHELLNREIIPAEVEKIIAMNIYDYWNSDKNVVGWIKQQIGGPIRSME